MRGNDVEKLRAAERVGWIPGRAAGGQQPFHVGSGRNRFAASQQAPAPGGKKGGPGGEDKGSWDHKWMERPSVDLEKHVGAQ